MMVYKYWIRWRSPGSFVSEEWSADVDALPEPSEIDWPENAYSCQFFRQKVHEIDGETFRAGAEIVGPEYYHPDSVVTTLAELEAPGHGFDVGRALLDNMRINKWDAVIWTRWKNWPQPFDGDKVVIAA
jgi:hypothetical protein